MSQRIVTAILYNSLGFCFVLSCALWTENGRATAFRESGLVLDAEIRGVYAKEEAFQRFISEYKARIEILRAISEQQKRFKEEHPDWPGTLPLLKDLPNPVASATFGRSDGMPDRSSDDSRDGI